MVFYNLPRVHVVVVSSPDLTRGLAVDLSNMVRCLPDLVFLEQMHALQLG